MTWYGKDACVAPLPSMGKRTPQGEMNFPGLGCLLSSIGKSRQEHGVSQHHHGGDSPLLEAPCAHQYKMVFRPVVVRARTSSSHDTKHYWLLLRTTTGSLADHYWSDFPPPTALDLNSADFALTEQIKGLGLLPCGGRPRHVRRERE